MHVVFLDEDVMLRIPAELEKVNKDRLLPIAPEFAEFLRRTPAADRHGKVFKPEARSVRGEQLTADRVSRLVSRIGKAANIVVDPTTKKYVSADDLRRSFGERWAALMPQVLMELMWHESIETTLKYYVGQNAQRTSRLIREAYEQAQTRLRESYRSCVT